MPKRVSNTPSSTVAGAPPQARQASASSSIAAILALALIELGVDQEAEPEGLEHEEDQPGASVEEAEPQHVAIEEQEERAQEARQAVVGAAQRALALDRIAAQLGRDAAAAARAAARRPRRRPIGCGGSPTRRAACGYRRSSDGSSDRSGRRHRNAGRSAAPRNARFHGGTAAYARSGTCRHAGSAGRGNAPDAG